MPWVLKMFRPMLPGETMEAALVRLAELPGVLAVDRGEPLPVTFVRSRELEGMDPEEIRLLVQNPGLMPLDVRVAWLDGAVADHLRDEGEAVREAYRHVMEEARAAHDEPAAVGKAN